MHVGAARDDADMLAALRPYVQGDCVIGFDAPLVVTNPTGQRPAEAALNRDFGRFEAGAHPANTGKPEFADGPRAARLAARWAWTWIPRRLGRAARRAIEVYPHAATVALFRLARTLKYKAKPGRGLDQLKSELLCSWTASRGSHTPPCRCTSPIHDGWAELRRQVVTAQRKSELRRAEDPIDAVVCAYVALYADRCPAGVTIYGDFATGYIVTPSLPPDLAPQSDPHGSLVDRRKHVDEVDHGRQRRSSRVAPFDQGGNHRTVDSADQRAHQFDAHGTTRSLDGLGDRLGALPQAAAHAFRAAPAGGYTRCGARIAISAARRAQDPIRPPPAGPPAHRRWSRAPDAAGKGR